MEERQRMVAGLRGRGLVFSERVEKALLKVPRHLFVPESARSQAYRDTPLPIGDGQTISAPHMVAVMAEALELREGHKVLEIGAGSGYNAAVMAELVGPTGKVITLERHPSLADKAAQVLLEAGYTNVQVVVGDGSLGYPEEAPYDRISVTCGAPRVPNPLVEQLRDGGIMLIPVGGLEYQSLLRVRKLGGRTLSEDLGSVVFVPLLGEKGHRSQ
ncbi:MAG TPA: protein-L-isoaspartate O-methyltransferase [Methanomassiliicoccales archaeon]|nr:MAG: Protein-L-isoaspartate O-methyltransferase [Methanomassiliicoccales archaeon PtaB.Bin215]HNU35813.1 protein-L-isoaspartate O-methyltransferase [Methanomassiliicoccales archaeon]